MTPILKVDDLSVQFKTYDGSVRAVSNVSFTINRGECLGIVGESGSGKTQTFLAVLGLLADNGTAIGKAEYGEKNLLALSRAELDAIRGRKISVVFQDALTSLTPHMRVGDQLIEALQEHQDIGQDAARAKALQVLERVRIPEAERRMRMYPHELSGGMRQRIMIAIALICGPDILIADEPTTALDVTVQAQILQIFSELRRETQTSIVLITHDMGVVAGLCDRVLVMYAGKIVEEGKVEDIFYDPRHPYTQGLLGSMPRLTKERSADLTAIPGQPPNMEAPPSGCDFHPRCAYTFEKCTKISPPLRSLSDTRRAACHLLETS